MFSQYKLNDSQAIQELKMSPFCKVLEHTWSIRRPQPLLPSLISSSRTPVLVSRALLLWTMWPSLRLAADVFCITSHIFQELLNRQENITGILEDLILSLTLGLPVDVRAIATRTDSSLCPNFLHPSVFSSVIFYRAYFP